MIEIPELCTLALIISGALCWQDTTYTCRSVCPLPVEELTNQLCPCVQYGLSRQGLTVCHRHVCQGLMIMLSALPFTRGNTDWCHIVSFVCRGPALDQDCLRWQERPPIVNLVGIRAACKSTGTPLLALGFKTSQSLYIHQRESGLITHSNRFPSVSIFKSISPLMSGFSLSNVLSSKTRCSFQPSFTLCITVRDKR